MRGQGREVGEFAGIRFVVVEFAALFAGVPLGIAPTRSPQTVAGEASAAGIGLRRRRFALTFAGRGCRAAIHLRERPTTADRRRIAQQRDEALTLEIGGRLHPSEFGERREKIEVADRRGGDGFSFRNAGGDDEQRHAGAFFEDALFLPESVFTGVIAVVAGEDDDRALREAEAVEGGDDAADLDIHKTDTGVVALEGVAALIVGHVVLLTFVAAEARGRDVGLVFLNVRHNAHFLARVVTVVGIFRGDVGRVRTEKTDGEKEGPLTLLGATREHPLGVGGQHGVGVVLVAFR